MEWNPHRLFHSPNIVNRRTRWVPVLIIPVLVASMANITVLNARGMQEERWRFASKSLASVLFEVTSWAFRQRHLGLAGAQATIWAAGLALDKVEPRQHRLPR